MMAPAAAVQYYNAAALTYPCVYIPSRIHRKTGRVPEGSCCAACGSTVLQ